MAGLSGPGEEPGSDVPDEAGHHAELSEPPERSAAAGADALVRAAEETAAARGRAMVSEARAVRKRMLDDVERRRQALLAELEHLRSVLDDLARGLAEPMPGDVPTDPAAPIPSDIASGEEPAAHDVFARLREERDHPSVSPPDPPPPAPALAAEQALPEPEPSEPPPTESVPAAPPPDPPSPDDATRRRRDEMLAPLTVPVLRASKRLLQDEQNELLDAIRRARGRVEAARLLPDPEKQHGVWSAVLGPSVDEAYTVGRALTGRRRRPTAAPRRLVAELAAALVTPLRERVAGAFAAVAADGPYDAPGELQSALGPAISARYREWRARELEGLLADLLAAAYARGAFDATPSGATLRWVPAEVGQCPDADDNSLEPTVKGQCFPTGQPYPPAHPGCRCLVVPSDVGSVQEPV